MVSNSPADGPPNDSGRHSSPSLGAELPPTAAEWYRILSETAPDGIIVMDERSTILSVNPAAAQMFGYATAELLGEPLMRLIPPRLRAAHKRAMERHQATGRRTMPWNGSELPGLTKSGDEIPLEISFGESILDGNRIYAGFIRDIRDRKRIEAEREALLAEAHAARAEAEEANRAKSQFLSTMSHEIRTPINAIMGYTELLELGIEGTLTEGQREQLERVRTSSLHLLGLVNDVLDLAKVEAGALEIARQPAVVDDAVLQAISLVGPQAAAGDVSIRNDCGRRSAVGYIGDADRVRQILLNLLSNAIKFTASGGVVRIRCGVEETPTGGVTVFEGGPWTCVSVADTGIGIEAAELDSIFSPFRQAQGGLTRRSGGSGLGLTISRQLARLMGGDISAQSSPGKGSTFTLWLPQTQSATTVAMEDLRHLASNRGSLRPLGEHLREGAESIVEKLVTRLREEPLVPRTEPTGQGDYEDHIATFLADLGQHLIILDTSEADPVHLLRDGSEIQRMIADLHGGQRARLGWPQAAVHREFEIILEEVLEDVGRRMASAPEDDVEAASSLLTRLIQAAEQTSLAGYRRHA